MTTFQEGVLTFTFDATADVQKYDEWPFYKNQFCKSCTGSKAVDFVGLRNGDRDLWLIEVKDYRRHPRTKTISIWDEIAVKARDTLAGLLSTSTQSPHTYLEQTFARRAVRAAVIRIVFHLEQPRNPSKLFPQSFDPANLQLRLRQSVRPIDPHARVVDRYSQNIFWNVV